MSDQRIIKAGRPNPEGGATAPAGGEAQRRVIKATDPLPGRLVPFNSRDTLQDAEQRITAARADVEKYRDEVSLEVAKLADQAQQQGYKAGYEAGLAAATKKVEEEYAARVQAEVSQRVQSLTPAVKKLLGQLAAERTTWLAQWEHNGLELALAIASRVLRRPSEDASDLARAALSEALQLAGRWPSVSVHLHPNDAQTLQLDEANWRKLTRSVGEIHVVSDDSVTPGGCVLESEFGRIDATLETQLARIESELLGRASDRDAKS